MGKRRTDTSQYLLRMDPETKTRLAAKADEAGVPLSHAFRVGAERYLDEQLGGEEVDPLLADFRALASRIDDRFKR